jgi:hypothetical protein
MKTYRLTIQISAKTFAHISIIAENIKEAMNKASQRGMVISAHPSNFFRETEYLYK